MHNGATLSSLRSLCSFSAGGAFSPASVITQLEANPRFGRSLFNPFLSPFAGVLAFGRCGRAPMQCRLYTYTVRMLRQLRRHKKPRQSKITMFDIFYHPSYRMFRSGLRTSAPAVCSGSWSWHQLPVAGPSGRSRQLVPVAGPSTRSMAAGLASQSRRQAPAAGPDSKFRQ